MKSETANWTGEGHMLIPFPESTVKKIVNSSVFFLAPLYSGLLGIEDSVCIGNCPHASIIQDDIIRKRVGKILQFELT